MLCCLLSEAEFEEFGVEFGKGVVNFEGVLGKLLVRNYRILNCVIDNTAKFE